MICVSRRNREPYQAHAAWKSVGQVVFDREEADKQNAFGGQMRDLASDVVIDLICFTQESAQSLVEALQGRVQHYLHCGTIWIHGHSEQVPTDEAQPRKPFGAYGINRAAIEHYLLNVARKTGFPATLLRPGHIVGPGWIPLNPAGNFNPEVYTRLAEGKEVTLPNLGNETVHHVHADDVAQSFIKAMDNRVQSLGESFHIVSPKALTLRGYAEAMGAWIGQKAELRFLPWKEWKLTVSEADAEATWDHIAHSPNCSIDKAKRLLNYNPRYSSLVAVQESVKYLMG